MSVDKARHFETKLRQELVIRTMLNDLDRTARQLDIDLAAEEQRSLVFDRSDPTYSILAKSLATRRDNLKHTIVALQQRLALITDGMAAIAA